ncbi:arginine repressor [Syntrophomonas palmitatica]|uniref:arginine repressor n=1 Tax=Syntrophomonas palmitatica TaxID=402877 RepID=UPI0006D16186|nr:arginine repressor [Syntrophomonas palmitatica]
MKQQRRYAIINIINENRIETQEELREALLRAGYSVTQATVSRDIKDLHLVKAADARGYRYALPGQVSGANSQERIRRIFTDSVLHLDYSENIIVLKTLPGGAQAVASLIDTMGRKEILGTVGGDDTILVVIKPIEAVPVIMEEFSRLLRNSI